MQTYNILLIQHSPFFLSFKGSRVGPDWSESSCSSLVTTSLWGLRAKPEAGANTMLPALSSFPAQTSCPASVMAERWQTHLKQGVKQKWLEVPNNDMTLVGFHLLKAKYKITYVNGFCSWSGLAFYFWRFVLLYVQEPERYMHVPDFQNRIQLNRAKDDMALNCSLDLNLIVRLWEHLKIKKSKKSRWHTAVCKSRNTAFTQTCVSHLNSSKCGHYGSKISNEFKCCFIIYV